MPRPAGLFSLRDLPLPSRCSLAWPCAVLALAATFTACTAMAADDSANTHASPANGPRPNILWITSEDNGPQLGCYGDTYADTPRLDDFATGALRYRTCWSNAPVCAPARTTLIAGMHATSLGGQHMRSGVRLPRDTTLYPRVLRDAGYFCTNNAKTDYNFAAPDAKAGWNLSGKQAHWRKRPDAATPFFSVFNFTISHESQIRNQPHTLVHDPEQAPVPVYHPDVPEVRRDWAQYYDRLTEMDAMVGNVLDELRADGLEDSTIVFYYGDHGSGMPRSKRWPFNSGLHVPLLVHIPKAFTHLAPEDYAPGAVSDRLVSFVDFAPTAISLAGATPPANMQGVPFCGITTGPAKPYLFGYRGRMDERIDMVRSCTDGRFVYMRHFYPERPYLKHVGYMFQTPTTRIWKDMFDAGELNESQAKFWQPKPVEELFDLENDPDEVHNLANDPQYHTQLTQMRSALQAWMVQTRDLGVLPEAEVHRLADAAEVAPRALASRQSFPIQALVDAAWEGTRNWAVADETTVAEMIQTANAEHSGIRFWGTRGLVLALASHGSILPESALDAARQALSSRLQDESPSVRIAAAEGLLIAKHPDSVHLATAELLQLADLRNAGHYAAVEAINIIDAHRDAFGDSLRETLAALPVLADQPPKRAEEYVQRLMDYLQQDLR